MAIPYILLTTTNLFTTQFLSYLHNSSYYLYNEASLFNQFNLLNYGYYPLIDGENIDNIYSTTSVAAVCSSNMKSFNSNEVQNILRDYYNLLEEENRISWSVNQPNMSCCVLDGQRNLLWLLGDHVGSVPLWFGFLKTGNRQDIIVTTDLFAAIYLGYSDLTAVGAGLSLPFDMETFDLLSMNHWTQYNYDPTFQEPDLQSSSNWSNSILDAAKSVIAKYDDVHLYTELDLLDASSILLECAIVNQSDFNKKLRSRYKKAPLVVDTPAFPVIDPYTQCQ